MGQVFGDGRGSRRLVSGMRVIGVAMVAILVAGCGAASSPPPGGSAGSPASNAPTGAAIGSPQPPTMSASDALRTYGYGPSPNPSVTFQPDVVVVGGGPASIRWGSDDGHTWAIDPAAPGASRLQVGSVMLLTSRAVGRVIDLRDEDGSRVVTVGPVQLTELFSDANFNLTQPVDVGSMAYQALPETPGDLTTPSSSASADPAGNLSDNGASPSPGALVMPTVRFASYRSTATLPADAHAATNGETAAAGQRGLPGDHPGREVVDQAMHLGRPDIDRRGLRTGRRERLRAQVRRERDLQSGCSSAQGERGDPEGQARQSHCRARRHQRHRREPWSRDGERCQG